MLALLERVVRDEGSMIRLFMVLPVALVAASGCKWGVVCTLEIRPGISVTIVDAATGSPAQGDVTVIATEGSYEETVNLPAAGGPQTALLAFERAGMYRVEAQAPGYAPWVAPLVRVTEDDCHVRTVDLTARLEKAEAG